ncbi:MAG: hypothetical protein GX049_05095 [Alcaligenaceae bacterium]|nr:hypothetical protein [Alcaligenaceae bacterium]
MNAWSQSVNGLYLLRCGDEKCRLWAVRLAIVVGLASGNDLSEEEVFNDLEARLQAMDDRTE